VNKVKDSTTVTTTSAPPPRTIYRLFEIVDGRKVVTGYQDHPPSSGLFEEVRKVR
jgi:hypothetical protein